MPVVDNLGYFLEIKEIGKLLMLILIQNKMKMLKELK
jgi:hypothetical protein